MIYKCSVIECVTEGEGNCSAFHGRSVEAPQHFAQGKRALLAVINHLLASSKATLFTKTALLNDVALENAKDACTIH
jgi:hypothetical protein